MFKNSLVLATLILIAPFLTKAQNAADEYVNHGIVRLQKNDMTGAISDFTKAIALNPNLAEAFCNRGVARGFVGEFDSALADFAKAIALKPNFDEAFYNRANLRYRRGEIDASLSDYTRAITLNSKRADYFYGRGLTYVKKADYDGAISDFSKAVKINSKYTDAYVWRARSLRFKSNLGGAIADYEKAIGIAPNNVYAYNEVAWLLATSPQDEFRNGKKALEYARKACELSNWNDAHALDTLAAAFAEMGDFNEATKWEKKALDDPQFAKNNGNEARERLQLYSNRQPYRVK